MKLYEKMEKTSRHIDEELVPREKQMRILELAINSSLDGRVVILHYEVWKELRRLAIESDKDW